MLTVATSTIGGQRVQGTTRILCGGGILAVGICTALLFPRGEVPRVQMQERAGAEQPLLPVHDLPLLADDSQPAADAAIIPLADPARLQTPRSPVRSEPAADTVVFRPVRPHGMDSERKKATSPPTPPPEPALHYPSMAAHGGVPASRTTVRFDFPPPAARGARTEGVDLRSRRRHRVVDGDTLPRLAERYYGRRDLYMQIFQANRNLLTDPELLPIGVELLIPEAAAVQAYDRAGIRGDQADALVPVRRPG